MMDALGDIVSRARIMGRIDFQAPLSADFGVRFPETSIARYHFVKGNECWATVDGTPTPLQLNGVSLLIIPRGLAHSIAGSIDTPLREINSTELDQIDLSTYSQERPRERSAKTDGAFLVSGVFEMDPEFGNLLINELPDILHVPIGQREEAGWLGDAVRFIAHEVAENAPGASAIADRIGEIIFIETIKSFAETASLGLVASLRDSNISLALNAFHQAPASSWTVAKLAKEAGLSRSIFAERASALLGMTPIQYVRDWRLMLARRLLNETQQSVETIAHEVGYASTRTFVKAYRDYYGVAPRANIDDPQSYSAPA